MALRQRADIDDADYDEAEGDVPVTPLATVVALHPEVRFTALEVQVIALARTDTLASLEAPGLVERLVALLFGVEPGRKPLADARLETLRRAVVVARHRHHLPDAIAAELSRIGYGPAQIRAIEALAIEN